MQVLTWCSMRHDGGWHQISRTITGRCQGDSRTAYKILWPQEWQQRGNIVCLASTRSRWTTAGINPCAHQKRRKLPIVKHGSHRQKTKKNQHRSPHALLHTKMNVSSFLKNVQGLQNFRFWRNITNSGIFWNHTLWLPISYIYNHSY